MRRRSPATRGGNEWTDDAAEILAATTLTKARPARQGAPAPNRREAVEARGRRFVALEVELGGARPLLGLWVCGLARLGADPGPTKLEEHVVEVFAAATRLERERAFDRLAGQPRFVSPLVMVRGKMARDKLKRLLTRTDGDWPAWRELVLPHLLCLAVRCGWRDIQAGPTRVRIAGRVFTIDIDSPFRLRARYFHQQTMTAMGELLLAFADAPKAAADVARRPLLKPIDRDLLMLGALGKEWARRAPAILNRAAHTLENRRWRYGKNREVSGKG